MVRWIGAGSNSDSSDISGSDPMMISLYPLGVESNNKEGKESGKGQRSPRINKRCPILIYWSPVQLNIILN